MHDKNFTICRLLYASVQNFTSTVGKIIKKLVFSPAKKYLSFALVCQQEISVYISKHSFCLYL